MVTILAKMFRVLQFCLKAASVAALFIILRVVFILNIPIVKKMLTDHMMKVSTLEYDDFKDSFLGIEMLKTCWKQLWLDCFMTFKTGCTIEADNYLVCRIPSQSQDINDNFDDGDDCVDQNANFVGSVEDYMETPDDFITLGTIARKGVPLVLNFGSCS